MQHSTPAIRILPAIFVCALWVCSVEPSNGQTVKQGKKVELSHFAASGCDASLWNHVYNPTRLNQLAPCISVTGVITESSADPDGDQHFLLKLDPGQEKLV